MPLSNRLIVGLALALMLLTCASCTRRRAEPLQAPPPPAATVASAPTEPPPPDKRAYRAAKRGDVAALRQLISTGADISGEDMYSSPLWYAVAHRRADIADLLLKAGARADPGLVNVAARHKDMATHKVLVSHGLRASVYDLRDAARWSTPRVCELLLDAGAPLNVSTPRDGTALYQAAVAEDPRVIRLLLSRGAYQTLHTAAMLGDTDSVRKAVLKGADPNSQDPGRRGTALHWAAARGHVATVRCLLHLGASPTLAIPAPKEGEVNADGTRATPLHWAALDGQVATARILVANGAKISVPDRWKCTPLHYAAESGSIAMCRFLINHGAKLEARDDQGRTPLFIAVRERNHHLVGYLLDRGARLQAKDDRGRTCIWSLKDGRTARVLRRYGANLHERIGETTLLHHARRDGDASLIEYLLRCGLDPDARMDSRSPTPLIVCAMSLDREDHVDHGDHESHTGARRDRKQVRFDPQADERIARLLLDYGADVNAEDMAGQTALDAAHGDPSMQSLLRRYGGRTGSQKRRSE